MPFRPSFSACWPPPSLSLPPLCGSFVSSEVRATRLLAEVANRAQHGGADSERRGVRLHTLGSAPLRVMGLFKVTPLQKTTFFLNSPKTPTAEASLSLSLSLLFSSSLSSALYIKLPTRFCLNEQKSQKIKKNAEYRQATSPPSKTILFSETGWFVLRAAAVSSQYKINVGRVGFMGLFYNYFHTQHFLVFPKFI